MTDTLTIPIIATVRLRQRVDGTWRGTLFAKDVTGEHTARWEMSLAHPDPDRLERQLATNFAELMGAIRPGRLVEVQYRRAPLPEGRS